MAKKQINKNYLTIVVVALLLAGVGFAGSYIFSHKNSKTAVQSSTCQGNCISLKGSKADPEVLTITAGEYVQFNSADGGRHNIALEHSAVQHEDEHEYESGDFEKDEAFRVQFKKDGAYTFRDKYNPDISINIIVYTKDKKYGI